MTERPILMCGEMVCATLEDRKTNTRRVVKGVNHSVERLLPFARGNTRRMCGHDAGPFIKCPYGVPGDRLWVRENGWEPIPSLQDIRDGADTWPAYAYDASMTKAEMEQAKEWKWKRRPSIHMPRWASRITLEITGIKVERVKDISEADARAEGVEPNCPDRATDLTCPSKPCESCDCRNEYRHYLRGDEDFPAFSARESFESLWDSINAARGFGWKVNPWVWVVQFRRVS